MSRSKPAKSSSISAAKQRLSPRSETDVRLEELRRCLRTANDMTPNIAVEAIYDEVATQAEQLGGGAADWESPFGRIYLEARLGLAATKWTLQGPAASLDMLQSLLDFDPADNVLARNWLLATLLHLDRNDEATTLLQRFPDSSALWRFAGALLAFRRHGDREQSSQLLSSARDGDPGFLDYLLGQKVVRADLPVKLQGKSAKVAHGIARLTLPAWRNTPGAAAWARRVLGGPLTRPEPAAESKAFPRDELRRLPRKSMTWQLGLKRLVRNGDEGESSDETAIWLLAIADFGER
ncbi:MAG TPA: hypothetical protein PLV92_24630, partial [Pirellulaceae bacterium]|nr:hypothetical protein [Pirellulaceae bacterium]